VEFLQNQMLMLPDRYKRVVQMPLPMARPVRDSNTGIYGFRKVVPESLRALVGKHQIKRSLNIRDANEAKRLHALMASEIEAEWANCRTRLRRSRVRAPQSLPSAKHTNARAGWKIIRWPCIATIQASSDFGGEISMINCGIA